MQIIYRDFSMDYTSEREYAQRPDGQWFKRSPNSQAARDKLAEIDARAD